MCRTPSFENLFVDVSATARSPASDLFLDSLIKHERQPLEPIDEAVGFAKSYLGKGSLISSVFTLVASAMGAGCLSLPHMFRRTGLGLGVILLACGAALAHVSLVVLMSCARYTQCRSFAELVRLSGTRDVLGSAGGAGNRTVFVDVVIALYGMAAVLIYLMLIGDFLAGIAESPVFGRGDVSRGAFITASLLLLFPLSVPKSVTALRYISILSTSSIAFMTLVVLAKTPGFLLEGSSDPAPSGEYSTGEDVPGSVRWFAGDLQSTLQSFAIALFAFNAHTNAVPVAIALQQPRAVRIWQVSLLSVLIEFVVYLLIASGGYLSFRGATQQDFIRNYPTDDTWMLIVRCVYSVPVVFGVPINLSPAAASMQALARRALSGGEPAESGTGGCSGQKSGRSGASHRSSDRALHVTIVAGVLGLCAALAIWCEAVADVIGLFGGFFGTLICLAWPRQIYHGVLSKLHSKSLAVKAAVLIPWSIKPLMGLLSDSLPIWGYHRGPYFAIVGIAGCAAYACIATTTSIPLTLLLLLLFIVFLQITMSDLLSEAVYSVHLRDATSHGPDLITFVWSCVGVGKLQGVALAGPLIASYGPRAPYAVCVFIAALALLIPALNLSGEKQNRERCCTSGTRSDPLLATVACITGLGALALAVLSVLGSSLRMKVICAGILGLICLGSVSLVLSPVIAKVNAFFFIQHLCTWSVDGASFFFFTDGEKQYPEGPHFSTEFYTSVLGLVSTVFSLAGMFAYTRWMRDWRYPSILVVGNVLSAAVGLVSCLVYSRWNLRLGLDDHFFVLASGAVQTVVFEMAWLPGMLILSQLCPEGREATVFALLAGMGNLGMGLGGYFGAYLLHLLGVEPRGSEAESNQFSRLWIAALVSALGPCVPLCLVGRLIPNVSQQERLEGVGTATSSSLLSRLMGWHDVPSTCRSAVASVELCSIVGRHGALAVDAEDEVPNTPSSGQLC